MVVVADAFLVMNFDELVGEIGELAGFAEAGDGFIDCASGGQKDFGLFYKTRGDAFDVKERHALHEGVDGIDDVIQIADEGVDVFAVEWGDEGAVEPIEGGMAEIV